MGRDEQWRPLADALQASMTETGVEPSYDYVQSTAKAAADWLDARGYAVVFVSRCWCEGKADGTEHTPGCAGMEQDRMLGRA